MLVLSREYALLILVTLGTSLPVLKGLSVAMFYCVGHNMTELEKTRCPLPVRLWQLKPPTKEPCFADTYVTMAMLTDQ